jgi:transcriptional regulator with XRE-family HTH domain
MLGRELRKARHAAKITQEELAFEAGIDRTYISQLENDRKSPTVAVLLRLAAVLSVPASSIIARVEKEMSASKSSSHDGPKK